MSSFRQFLAENKLWWITPIVVVLGAVAWVVFFQPGDTTGADPFEYDLF